MLSVTKRCGHYSPLVMSITLRRLTLNGTSHPNIGYRKRRRQQQSHDKYSKERRISMESIPESSCTSIFQHNPSELSEAFTQLWIQFINDREEKKNTVLQTDIAGL